jgi:hypothetical protein
VILGGRVGMENPPYSPFTKGGNWVGEILRDKPRMILGGLGGNR